MSTRRLVRDLAQRETLSRLVDMGVLHPRFLAAGAAALPWLVGRGPSLAVLSKIHALSRPTDIAVIDREGAVTWRALDRRVNALAGALEERGIRADDQVCLVVRNGRRFVETVLACQRIGVVAAPLNTWGKQPELGGILEREQPAALVYDVRHADQLRGVVPDATLPVHAGDDADALDGSTSYEDLVTAGSSGSPSPVTTDRGSARIVIHTSGTTGTPKAASRGTGARGGASLLSVLDAVPYRHDDVMYMPNPMFHALGVLTFSIGMITGARMVLPDGFDPRDAWRHLDEQDITAASFVPVMLRRMLDLDDPPQIDLDRLRIVLVSGSAMPPELRRRTMERLGDVLYDLYGSTEAGWVAVATPRTLREAPQAVGRPVAGVDLAILDEDGQPVDDGEGEIHVRSIATFEGYSSGEDTEERDGYLSTGDLGRIDEHGYLHIVGRADDMAVVGGENVYPDEVEAVLTEVEGVEDAAVVGVQDEEMGQVLVAFLVGDPDVDRVRSVCQDELPSYKVPRRFHVVDELPRTSTGKVVRNELEEPEAEDAGASA